MIVLHDTDPNFFKVGAIVLARSSDGFFELAILTPSGDVEVWAP